MCYTQSFFDRAGVALTSVDGVREASLLDNLTNFLGCEAEVLEGPRVANKIERKGFAFWNRAMQGAKLVESPLRDHSTYNEANAHHHRYKRTNPSRDYPDESYKLTARASLRGLSGKMSSKSSSES
jgi:hypothetical protein